MTTTLERVRREQPGELEGATESALVFTLQAPQSHDQDPDGALLAAVRAILFPAPEHRAAPGASPASGLAGVQLRRGVLVGVPDETDRGRNTPVGAFAAERVVDQGINAEMFVRPLIPVP
jgi:hypothetical protein